MSPKHFPVQVAHAAHRQICLSQLLLQLPFRTLLEALQSELVTAGQEHHIAGTEFLGKNGTAIWSNALLSKQAAS